MFHTLTGLYCPGCGGTRAVRSLLRGGGLRMSVQYHPLVLYVIFVVLLEIILRTASGKRKRPMDREKRYRIFILTGVVLVAANWIFKNYMLVFRGVDLLPLMK